jgi:hypothetical protein
MSAAAVSISAPLAREGNEFWQQLLQECQRQIESINSVIGQKGFSADDSVRCSVGPELHLVKTANPSTLVRLLLGFYPWGPMLSLSITGQQADGSEFFPEEWELPVALDGDGSVVAIYDEGRSFSPRELAAYLTQVFRRCFPGVCLFR